MEVVTAVCPSTEPSKMDGIGHLHGTGMERNPAGCFTGQGVRMSKGAL
jgi:hypothetical protein